MTRETNAFLIAIVAVAIIVMNTNSAIGNGRLEAAIAGAQTMHIEHTARTTAQNAQLQSAEQQGVSSSQGTITANFGENTKNIDSNNVLILQRYLASHGFLKDKYVTGEFGPITKQAVKNFQAANGILPATGYVGDQTRAIVNAGN